MIKLQHLLFLCSIFLYVVCLFEIRTFMERATCTLRMEFTQMYSKSQIRAQQDERVRQYRTSVSNPHHGRMSRTLCGLAAVAQLFVLLSGTMWHPAAWRLTFEGAIHEWLISLTLHSCLTAVTISLLVTVKGESHIVFFQGFLLEV